MKTNARSTGSLVAIFTAAILLVAQQPLPPTVGPLPVSPVPHPNSYRCPRVLTPPVIDGRLDDAAWTRIPWTDTFVDIEGHLKPRPRFQTRAKMAWDSEFFYVAAWMEEPHVWATLTDHDSVIFRDNDFEVFIDPDGDNHNYFEFEINALNTGWDLFLPRPYKDQGKADNSWGIPGLKTAVHVDGTLNDPSDRDRGWSVEMAFPWTAFRRSAGVRLPPRDGDRWRVNFSRVEWQIDVTDGGYSKKSGLREDNWVWSPQFAINMHRPETWGYVEFSASAAGPEIRDPLWTVKEQLHAAYYRQREYRHRNGRFASSLDELGIEVNGLRLSSTSAGFVLEKSPCSIDQASLLRCTAPQP